LAIVVMTGVAVAEEPAPSPSPKPWYQRVDLTAFADVYYAYNLNRPADGQSFTPTTGTTAKRANEFALNLAALGVGLQPDPIGFQLTFGYGTSTEVVHAGEPKGGFIGPDAWRYVEQASISGKVPVGKGLLIEAGILPSHIGFESLYSKDNWNYTRSWQAELSPYYQAGVKLGYSFTSELSAQLWVMNGWQLISDNNQGKTLGTQVSWSSERFTVTFNTLAGPEIPGDSDHWRLFGDLILVVRPTSWLSLAVSSDLGYEWRPKGASAVWYVAAGYLRFSPRTDFAVTLRGDYFDDGDGGASGISQRLESATLTLEYRPSTHLLLRLEGRYDHSSAPVFSGHNFAAGLPVYVNEQGLVLLGAVVSL
jgi:hypothetical protein